MTSERVDFGGAGYAVEYNRSGRPWQVGRLNGRFVDIVWRIGEIPSMEARGALYLAGCQREERELRNRS